MAARQQQHHILPSNHLGQLPVRYRRKVDQQVFPPLTYLEDPLARVPTLDEGPSLHGAGLVEETDAEAFDSNNVADRSQGDQTKRVWDLVVVCLRSCCPRRCEGSVLREGSRR